MGASADGMGLYVHMSTSKGIIEDEIHVKRHTVVGKRMPFSTNGPFGYM